MINLKLNINIQDDGSLDIYSEDSYFGNDLNLILKYNFGYGKFIDDFDESKKTYSMSEVIYFVLLQKTSKTLEIFLNTYSHKLTEDLSTKLRTHVDLFNELFELRVINEFNIDSLVSSIEVPEKEYVYNEYLSELKYLCKHIDLVVKRIAIEKSREELFKISSND